MSQRKPKTTADANGVKHTVVAAEIRRRIAEREWQPGLRLPARRDLQREFGLASPTMALAMRCLVAEGFIRADGRLGTYVADTPPCFTRFGLVFPKRETVFRPWPKFWHALQLVAKHWTSEGFEQWVMYYDNEERAPDGSGGNEDYQRLVADTLERRVAGLVFAANPWALAHTPVLQQSHVPMTAVGGEPLQPGVGLIYLDTAGWLACALDRLKERKCRRIAVMTHDASPERCELFTSAASARGLKLEPFAIQANSSRDEAETKQCVHMMGMLGPQRRPDGLIVTDDSLVEGTAAGLAAAGLQVPRDIEVVAHWNFPLPPPKDVPFQWLGFDSAEVLKAGRENLEHPHARRKARSVIKIPPRFSSELVR